jgi:hypothetical protein
MLTLGTVCGRAANIFQQPRGLLLPVLGIVGAQHQQALPHVGHQPPLVGEAEDLWAFGRLLTGRSAQRRSTA